MKKLLLLFLSFFVFSLSANADEIKACTFQYDPVCWVDGKTYWNECTAFVKVAYKWECKDDKMLKEAMYGACPAIYFPVIWTDGKTYSNECMAKKAGAFVEKKIKIYFPVNIDSEEEFLKKFGKICSTASDWINTHFVKDGKFIWSTRVWVPADFKLSYTCIAYNWLVLEDSDDKILNSTKILTEKDKELLDSFLVKFYKKTDDFMQNLEKSKKAVIRLENYIKNTNLDFNLAVANYLRYEILKLFSGK